MIRLIATSAILMIGSTVNALATPAPGPDIEAGVLSMTVVAGLVYAINRRRKRN